MTSRLFVFVGLCLVIQALRAAVPHALEIREGDHVCLVGNTLAERVQHFNR